MGSGNIYTDEMRADAVRMVLEHAQPIKIVANGIGIQPDTLRRWVQRSRRERPAVPKNKPTYEELEAEIKRLRDDNKTQARELSTERKRVEFLGKAASFFAAETFDQPTGTR